MKEWVVISGKGGTGKTTVTAALAQLAAMNHTLLLADADVDAANLELLLSPQLLETHPFVGGQVAVIDKSRCDACGLCVQACRFAAINHSEGKYSVDELSCEGCHACTYACPSDAIAMVEQLTGHCYRSGTKYGTLFHARLIPGRENSGKLVSQVKQAARLAGLESRADLLLVDGPPGIGCPVIAALTGADLALVVTEPTVAGAHDLRRILGTARHFGVPAAVCVNKADINPAKTWEIRDACAEERVPLLQSIPYDPLVIDAVAQRTPVTEVSDGPAAQALRELWHTLSGAVNDPASWFAAQL